MARLTNRDVNRMSLGDALAAQDDITDWDRAHIASHKRMRSAGLGDVNSESRVSRIVTPVNQRLSSFIAPFGPVIDVALPSPPGYPEFKSDFKRVPIDALVRLVRPLDNFIYDIVNNSLGFSNVKSGEKRLTGLPGRQVEVIMGLDVPSNLDPYAKDYTKKLKAINNILIMSYQDPAALAKGVVKTIVDNVKNGKMQAETAVAQFAEFLKQASAAGVNLKSLAGDLGISAPDDRFFKALAQEVKNNLNNLPGGMQSILDNFANARLEEARRAAEEAKRVAEEAKRAAEAARRAAEEAAKNKAEEAKRKAEEARKKAEAAAAEAARRAEEARIAAEKLAAESRDVVRFFGEYLYFIYRHIGYNAPFNYWAAAVRINKDNTDSGVKWEIENFRNGVLRPLLERGDNQGWNGPVINRALKNVLDVIWQDLDYIRDTPVSDMAGRKSKRVNFLDLTRRCWSSYEGNPQYQTPSRLLSGPNSSESQTMMSILRSNNALGTMIQRAKDGFNDAKNALASSFPSVTGVPGLPASINVPGFSGYRVVNGIPMDAYTFKGLGLALIDDAIVAGGLSSNTALLGKFIAETTAFLGKVGVTTAPGTTPEITGLINQMVGMSTGGAVQMPTPPTITVQPQSVTVVEGGKATFSVTATLGGGGGPGGSMMSAGGASSMMSAGGGMSMMSPGGSAPGGSAATLSYQWAKDGVPIANATSSSLIVDGKLADSGAKYTVTVGKGGVPAATGGAPTADSVVSKPATLTVTAKETAKEDDSKKDSGSSDQKKDTMDTTPEKKSNILPIVLGAGAIAALPVAGPLAALALGAGAIATAMGKKKEAPAEKKPLSGYAGLYGYLGVTSMGRISNINTALSVPAKNIQTIDSGKRDQSSRAEKYLKLNGTVAQILLDAGLTREQAVELVEKNFDKFVDPATGNERKDVTKEMVYGLAAAYTNKPVEEKSNTALYVAGGLSVAGLILAAAYRKKK